MFTLTVTFCFLIYQLLVRHVNHARMWIVGLIIFFQFVLGLLNIF